MRPGFIDFKPARYYRNAAPFSGVSTSFEHGELWPGTMSDPFYPDTFTGFDAPTAHTPLESFELSGSWPDTLSNPDYPSSFTGFSTPSDATPLESFEAVGGWSGTAVTLFESFAYADAWPGTIPNADYPYTFTGFSTPGAFEEESFEAADGWPGT